MWVVVCVRKVDISDRRKLAGKWKRSMVVRDRQSTGFEGSVSEVDRGFGGPVLTSESNQFLRKLAAVPSIASISQRP